MPRSKHPNRRGYKILRELAFHVADTLDALDIRELKAAIKAADELTRTNCGWQVYRLGPGLRELAQEILDFKERYDHAE